MSVFFTRRGKAPESKLASDYAVGESVFLMENGTAVEYMVVQQGVPSSMYDSSCDGTWLLRKPLRSPSMSWDDADNDYKNSYIHSYLNSTFLGLFDDAITEIIKQVKIPYHNGVGNSGSIASGSSGLSTQIFLLSGYEVGWTTSTSSNLPVDGACLDYFSGTAATDTKRIAYYNGTAYSWWLRSPTKANNTVVYGVANSGYYTSSGGSGSMYVRPALILPYDTKFDPDTNTIL